MHPFVLEASLPDKKAGEDPPLIYTTLLIVACQAADNLLLDTV